MKNFLNEINSKISRKDMYSLFPSLFNINKKFNNIATNNNIKNNYNYNFHSDIISKRNRRKKRIVKEDEDEMISQNTYDIGNSLSNMKKQLNNVVVNEKNVLKIPKLKCYNSFNNKSNKLKNLKINKNNKKESEIEKSNIIFISKQISFSILKSTSEKYEIMMKNKDLQSENDLLKENIKFLLSQIRKQKKNESKKSITELSTIRGEINNQNNYNNNSNSENDNKINNVFDIIKNYKKEINSLKVQLKNISKENEELKALISNKIKKNEINQKDNYMKSMKIFRKNDIILKKPPVKNAIKINHKFIYNQRNDKSNLMLYKRKTFNTTFSAVKNHNKDTLTFEKNNYEKDYIQTFSNTQNLFNNNKTHILNYEDRNYSNYTFNSLNSKSRPIILIDSDFTGKEKMENKYILKKKKIRNIKSNYKYNETRTHSYTNKNLYYRKKASPNQLNKLFFDENFKSTYNTHTNTLESDKGISSKIRYDNNIFRLNISNKKNNS